MAIMEAPALPRDWSARFLKVVMAISCFPMARKKSRAPAPQKEQSQCVACSEPETATTIIVGGGVVGLSIAYWQSRMNKNQREIVVLEARNECFQGASGHNSGLVSCHWFSGGLRQLADHSFGIYQELARKKPTKFQDTCDYHENSLFQAHCGEGHTDPRAPYWIKAVDGWHLESEPKMQSMRREKSDRAKALQDNPSSATINPRGLGKWLYEQCREYGVSIVTDCTLYKVKLCPCGRLRSVMVKSAQGDRSYMCNDLVFAAGTQTPQLVRELFPGFSRDFHETNNSGNWIIVKSTAAFQDQKRAEVILDDVVNHQLEFVGRKDQATGDFVIWVCGLNNESSKLGGIDNEAEPDKDAINLLRKYAGQFLWNGESTQGSGLEVLEKGRTYRPTIDRELPILAAISRGDLCGSRISKEQCLSGQGDRPKSGVWVCTGHGRYGITLGLGSGKLMSQLILGERPDLDVAELGFPARAEKKRVASGLSRRRYVPNYKKGMWQCVPCKQAICGELGDLGHSCITISIPCAFGWRTKKT